MVPLLTDQQRNVLLEKYWVPTLSWPEPQKS